MRLPKTGEIWKHYKGMEVQIKETVWDASKEGEPRLAVVYEHEGMRFVRGIWNFLEQVPDHGARFVRG